MGAWMQNQCLTFAGGSPFNLELKKLYCKLESLRLYRVSEIDDVGSVDDDFFNLMLGQIVPCGINI